jgi:hypothetical protein
MIRSTNFHVCLFLLSTCSEPLIHHFKPISGILSQGIQQNITHFNTSCSQSEARSESEEQVTSCSPNMINLERPQVNIIMPSPLLCALLDAHPHFKVPMPATSLAPNEAKLQQVHHQLLLTPYKPKWGAVADYQCCQSPSHTASFNHPHTHCHLVQPWVLVKWSAWEEEEGGGPFIQEVIYVGIPFKICIDLHFWGEWVDMDDWVVTCWDWLGTINMLVSFWVYVCKVRYCPCDHQEGLGTRFEDLNLIN